MYTDSIEQAKTLKERRKKENNRITKKSEHSDKVVQLYPQHPSPSNATSDAMSDSEAASSTEAPSKNSQSTSKPSKIQVKPALYNSETAPPIEAPSEDLQSIPKPPKIQVKPALYVVSDWDEFVEDRW